MQIVSRQTSPMGSIGVAGFDGRNLWVNTGAAIVKCDGNLNPVTRINTSAYESGPCGMCTDGKHIYMIGETNDVIVMMDYNGNVLKKLYIGGYDTYASGIATDGKHIFWMANGSDDIYMLDKEFNVLKRTNLTAITVGPRGLGFENGGYFWFTNNAGDCICKTDRDGNPVYQATTVGIDTTPVRLAVSPKYIYWTGQVNNCVFKCTKNP